MASKARPGITTPPPAPRTLGSTPAAQRPGASRLPSPAANDPQLVRDPNLTFKISAAIPGILAHAPKGFGGGPHSGSGMNADASSAWLTAQLMRAGVPIPEGAHVMLDGSVIRERTFWEKYKYPIMAAATGATLGAAAFMAPAAEAAQSGGLLGFEGDGAVLGGMPAALPNATSLLGPSAESASDLGGVAPGLLGPSMETPADVAFANGTGGVGEGLLGPTAPHASADMAGSSIPAWLKTGVKTAAPFTAAAIANHQSNTAAPGASPLDPETQGILKNILNLSQQRLESTVPVHEAAMRLAMSMAPNGQYSPRMQQSIGETNQANPQSAQMSPNVQEAYRRLMQGNG